MYKELENILPALSYSWLPKGVFSLVGKIRQMEIKDKQESKSLYNMSQMDDIDNYYYWVQEREWLL